MDKQIHIIYYGKDAEKAKEVAIAVRAERKTAQVRHAEIFDGFAEECAEVTIMSCVSGHDAGRIRAAYGDKVKAAAPAAYVAVLPKLGDDNYVETLPKLGDDEPVVQPPATIVPPPVPSRKGR